MDQEKRTMEEVNLDGLMEGFRGLARSHVKLMGSKGLELIC